MSHNKITNGYVIQKFEEKDGRFVCINQEFIAGDPVEYEDSEGNPIEVDVTKEDYQPFNMIQPEPIKIIITVSGGLIQDIIFPPDCIMEIDVRDYDIEGFDDELKTDNDGNEYLSSIWVNPFTE